MKATAVSSRCAYRCSGRPATRTAEGVTPGMTVVITAEDPASPDARALIRELDAHLDPLYARESRHGFSVEKLIEDAVAFFVMRDGGHPAGCGGVKLFGTEY